MKEFFNNISDFHKSVLFSVAFHLVLVVLFVLIHSGLDLPDTEFAEIGFVSASTFTAVQPRPQQSAPAKAKQSEPQASPQASPPLPPKEEAKAPPVNLPTRRMLEEEPQLTRRKSGKLSPTADELKPTPGEEVYDAEALRKRLAEKSKGDKTFAQPGGNAQESAKSIAPPSDVGTTGGNTPYTIEGDAAKRTIVNQVLPEYPPGLNQEAVVKIRFWVLPDGRIGSMIPLRKGNPTLDQVTMRAMRQWRFNALPASAEQKNVEGIITFVYKLR